MIGHLKGKLLRRSPEVVLLDVGGVGYELHIPLSTFYLLEGRPLGSEVALHVHTHLREDALTLFGFSTDAEKRLFQRLLTVAGVGPRLARVILSGLPPAELAAAVAQGDTARLSAIPGVGRKTADRLVLELKDKIAELGAPPPASTASEELVSALVNLGYRRAEAEKAVAAVERERPGAELPERFRLALARLARV